MKPPEMMPLTFLSWACVSIADAASVQQVVSAYSLTANRWRTPTQFLSARLLRITASLTF